VSRRRGTSLPDDGVPTDSLRSRVRRWYATAVPHIPTITLLALAAALVACVDNEPRDAQVDTASDVSAVDATTAGDTTTAEATPERGRCELPADAAVTLPADDSRHSAPTEWFYWTGHLQSEDGRWFGFHMTVLVAGPVGHGIVLAHHSLTRADAPVGGGDKYAHGFALGLEKESELPLRGFAFDLDRIAVSGYDGNDVLASELEGSKLALALSDPRGPVVRHGNGFQDYGGGITTYYYARPRQAATGTLTVDGEELRVTGSVWFDHQWGTLAAPEASKWDWVAIQLEDGRDLMVVRLPIPGGDLFSFAELTNTDCTTETFYGEDVTFSGRKTWQSPESGCTYPMDWDITVADLHFALHPLTDDQEMQAEPIPYWEGAATVTGSAVGRAYVEMVGYCH